jgi:thiol-disulfide isomerase/thioredoxin
MSYTRLSSHFQPKSVFGQRRRFLKSFMTAAGGALIAIAPPVMAAPVLVAGKPVPSAAPTPPMTGLIEDEAGAAFDLTKFRGAPLLVNFWATWCPPCVAELPALDRAARALDGAVGVLLVSVDRGGKSKAWPFLEARGIKAPHIGFDAKAALSREMGVRGLPTTFLISADQRTSWTYIGPREWDQADMLDQIRDLVLPAAVSGQA